jgi:hypothetical protein
LNIVIFAPRVTEVLDDAGAEEARAADEETFMRRS